LAKLTRRVRQVMEQREREAGCPACAGRQRLVREGDPVACELCGRDDGAIIVSEIVVETAEDIVAATAAALAAGHELLGPFAWNGGHESPGTQTIEVIPGPPLPKADP
jgi:hypothetical protein